MVVEEGICGKYFSIHLEKTRSCNACGAEAKKIQKEYQLNLPTNCATSKSLEQFLADYMKPEIIQRKDKAGSKCPGG